MEIIRYACPCCGYKTLAEQPPGTYDICEVCFWEDDGVQYHDPDYEGGANQESLRTAQQNFLNKHNANGLPKSIAGYDYEGPKDVSKISRMPIIEMIRIFTATKSPIDRILDIYGGMLEIENSNYVFNIDELEDFLTAEDLKDYLIITRRKSFVKVPSGEEKINMLIKLSDEEAEQKIDEIRVRFVDAINRVIANG